MKTRLDYSGFTPEEIKFVRSNIGGVINKDNPHYTRIKLYYFDIEKGQDEIVTIECSQVFLAYNLKRAIKSMKERGYLLPYKSEWQRIIDEEEIRPIQERESLVEL